MNGDQIFDECSRHSKVCVGGTGAAKISFPGPLQVVISTNIQGYLRDSLLYDVLAGAIAIETHTTNQASRP